MDQRVHSRLIILGLTCLWWTGLAQAQPLNMETRLIHASDRPAALDTRLDAIEYRLRRIFQFEHYAFLGETRTLLNLPSQVRVDLGHGYHLQVRARDRGGRVQADIEWFRGAQRLINTSITQRQGVPAILGGPPHDGGTLILVVQFN